MGVERSPEQVALRRAVALIEQLLPWVMWDDLDCDEDRAHITLAMIKAELKE